MFYIVVTEISEFCSKCFFSRFTSWKSQRLSNEVITRYVCLHVQTNTYIIIVYNNTNVLLLVINHTLLYYIRLLKRKVRELPRACPDLPTDYSSNTLPHSFSRHSIGKMLYLLLYMYMFTGTCTNMYSDHISFIRSQSLGKLSQIVNRSLVLNRVIFVTPFHL